MAIQSTVALWLAGALGRGARPARPCAALVSKDKLLTTFAFSDFPHICALNQLIHSLEGFILGVPIKTLEANFLLSSADL